PAELDGSGTAARCLTFCSCSLSHTRERPFVRACASVGALLGKGLASCSASHGLDGTLENAELARRRIQAVRQGAEAATDVRRYGANEAAAGPVACFYAWRSWKDENSPTSSAASTRGLSMWRS